MRRTLTLMPVLFALAALPAAASQPAGENAWAAYLDYAYVYSSADSEALETRLAQYGKDAGVSFEDYLRDELGYQSATANETHTRRRAIAHLLHYLASGDSDALETSVDVIGDLEDRLERHENRYWYHYILAHDALAKGRPHDFVSEVLRLWLRVALPLETPYESLAALSLSESPNSGFVAALPYVFENITRLVVIRSQEMGISYGLDPLAAIMRMMHDGRVGRFADVIPNEASSSSYLDRIVTRLDGPESDGGSLTFTLALFEASKNHDKARSLLATQGLDAQTIEALRIANRSYEAALQASETAQGEAAVYARVLRLLGEVYAARQRLGVEIALDTSFSLEGAMTVYASLDELGEAGWNSIPGSNPGSYSDTLRGLWEEIQEASLNGADYYLSRSVSDPMHSDDHARSAAVIYSSYLGFFQRFDDRSSERGVPESAYFAAYEAARGFGDAFLAYSKKPTPTQIDLATKRYRSALSLFPFDPALWPALTAALGRHGRENEYLALATPVADFVAGSRSIHGWISHRENGWQSIATLRRALADSQVIMLLGFGNAPDSAALQTKLAGYKLEREKLRLQLGALTGEVVTEFEPTPASPAGGLSVAREVIDRPERERREREIAQAKSSLTRIDRQIETAERALPLFEATGDIDGLISALRTRRDHPIHTLLRRMYRESQI